MFDIYAVEVRMVRGNSVPVVRKEFPTMRDRSEWLERNEDKVVEVLRFEDDPETPPEMHEQLANYLKNAGLVSAWWRDNSN